VFLHRGAQYSGEQVLNSVKKRTESIGREQSRQKQSCDRAGDVCFVTDMAASAPHQISREHDIPDGKQWRRDGNRYKQEIDAHARQQHDRSKDDS